MRVLAARWRTEGWRRRGHALDPTGQEGPVRNRWRIRICLAAVVVTAATVLAGAARADFRPGLYTHGSCAGTAASRIDPVNFVFWDWGTADRAVDQTRAHAAWNDTSGSSQYFFDHGTCSAMTAQRASSGTFSSRFHIRLHPIHWDATLRWTTIGDAHHEDLTYCGHAVDSNGASGSGFDQGRRELRMRLESGGHGWYSEFWGNTQNFQQCDGDYAGSDGYTVFSRAHQVNH
jgi:hypothetical protein